MSTQTSTKHGSGEASLEEAWSPRKMVKKFLMQREPAFKRLVDIREKGWEDPQGDEYFKQQRQRADTAGKEDARKLFEMMKSIADELQATTGALTCNDSGDIMILDLCMAPGGYTFGALKYNRGATAYAITLPLTQGGHEVFHKSPQSHVLYLDITMLAKEFGVDTIQPTHPDYKNFLIERPCHKLRFNLIFCDGQVLRTHKRAEYRELVEASRLTNAQLILALQRIRPGGTLIILLHRLGSWETVELLYTFSHFSSIQVFKPKKKHAIRGSFYLIASNVQPDTDSAKAAVAKWKDLWKQATFEGEKTAATESEVTFILDHFGTQLGALARPVWEIQADALEKMPFTKSK